MFDRRTFLSFAAGSITAPRLASAQQQASGKVALYANVGADLTHYAVDVASAELIKRETVTLPAGVPYAWPHASIGDSHMTDPRGENLHAMSRRRCAACA